MWLDRGFEKQMYKIQTLVEVEDDGSRSSFVQHVFRHVCCI